MSVVSIQKVASKFGLYHKYPSRNDRQSCYVEVACGSKVLSADWNPEIGNAVPGDVFHGHRLRFSIPALVAKAANNLLEEILPHAERVVEGYESVWDGNNYVAKYDGRAKEAIRVIESICDGSKDDFDNIISAIDAAEYFADNPPIVSSRLTDKGVIKRAREAQNAAESENPCWLIDNVVEYFESLREEARKRSKK